MKGCKAAEMEKTTPSEAAWRVHQLGGACEFRSAESPNERERHPENRPAQQLRRILSGCLSSLSACDCAHLPDHQESV